MILCPDRRNDAQEKASREVDTDRGPRKRARREQLCNTISRDASKAGSNANKDWIHNR